jgi:hypothetical protein
MGAVAQTTALPADTSSRRPGSRPRQKTLQIALLALLTCLSNCPIQSVQAGRSAVSRPALGANVPVLEGFVNAREASSFFGIAWRIRT